MSSYSATTAIRLNQATRHITGSFNWQVPTSQTPETTLTEKSLAMASKQGLIENGFNARSL